MRILTWNINSVRLRIGHVLRLIKEHDPDIIALQETKTPDDKFPFQEIKDAGLPHIHIHGMKGYNGVALLSKHDFYSADIHHRVGQEDCRHIAASIKTSATSKPLEIHTLYVPAGGDEPDPDTNPKFKHKLDFVDEMTGWFKKHYTPDDPLVTLGDFNIAPLENDVWSHKQLLKVVSHTPPETERLEKMRNSLSWIDSSRQFVPEDEKCYTWWSYRNRDWKKSNRGRRLDHIWVTPPLKDSLKDHQILTHARDWEKPSDHVPVILDLDVKVA